MNELFDHLSELFFITFAIGLPVMLIFGRPYFKQWMALREKTAEIEARVAAEKAAQYATSNAELAARVAVLEQIVTGRGAETAAQIEALRTPRLSRNQKDTVL